MAYLDSLKERDTQHNGLVRLGVLSARVMALTDYNDDINCRSLMTNWLAGGSCYLPEKKMVESTYRTYVGYT